jgi:hypothetical protein
MTAQDYGRAAELRGRRKARRRRSRNRILVGVAILVAFGVGIALGQALHDNPQSGEQTTVQTIPALTQTTGP